MLNLKNIKIFLLINNSHIVLGPSPVYGLARRIHQLHMLDIQHILLAMEGESARSQRPEKDAHQLLPVGAVHTHATSAHVLFALGDMALIQHEDRLRHRHPGQVGQQHRAPEPGGERENPALPSQTHGQGLRGAARDELGTVRSCHQIFRQILLHHIRQAAGQLPAHHLPIHQATIHRERDRAALLAQQIPGQ